MVPAAGASIRPMPAPARHRAASPGRIAVRLALLFGVLAASLTGCGSAPTPAPTARPTAAPTPTPNPHLADPATADAVYRGLAAAGLSISANTAVSGGPGGEPRTTISATYAGWPLLLSEYSSRAALDAAVGSLAGPPGQGRPPYAFAGLNILVLYGPMQQLYSPSAPAGPFRTAAAALVDALDPLVGPLRQQAVVAVPLPSAAPRPASPTPPPAAS